MSKIHSKTKYYHIPDQSYNVLYHILSRELLSSIDDDSEVLQISLPSIKQRHLKRAIKFLYTGQMRVSKAEIERDHFLYYINYILRDIFRVDASIDLSSQYLRHLSSNNEDTDPDVLHHLISYINKYILYSPCLL